MRTTATVSERAHDLHRRWLVVDSLAGGPGVFPNALRTRIEQLAADHVSTPDLFRELERLQTKAFLDGEFDAYWAAVDAAMVDVLSVSIGAWGDHPFSFRGAVQDLGEWHRRFNRVDRFLHVEGADDLGRARESKRTGVLLGFQDSAQLEGDLRNLDTFHALGVRMIQLTYNDHGQAGSGCMAAVDRGLTSYGRELVRAMNGLGMIVDVSHCGPRTTLETIEASRAPVAVSHAACSTIHPHPRNKDDAVLRALAESGGYFGVCAVPAFLADRLERPSVDTMMRHLLHAVETCGTEHVGIGSDWGVYDSPPALTERLQAESRARGFRKQEDLDFADQTAGFESWAEGLPRVIQAMLGMGLTEQTVGEVLGANFERFYREVDQPAG